MPRRAKLSFPSANFLNLQLVWNVGGVESFQLSQASPEPPELL